MNIKKKTIALLLCCAYSLHSFATISEKELIQKIKTIEQQNHATIGVSAIHIEDNKKIAHNSNQRFFMASTFKVPIAVAFLHRVDQKKDSLARTIQMDTKNSVPGSGSLHYVFEKKQLSMSMQQLLRHMLIRSDNSASDTILHMAKGPKEVTQYLQDLGFKNMAINRSILEILLDTNHVDHRLLNEHRPVISWQKIFNSVPLAQKASSWQRFEKDSRDSTTPDEMARFLVKLQKKQILSESNTRLIMSIMEECKTGRSRIKGLLPNNVKVAHKTGTWSIDDPSYLHYAGSKNLYRFASDVGVITLPNNQGHVAIAVYVKSQSASNYTRAHSIALTSRAIYDYFMQKTPIAAPHKPVTGLKKSTTTPHKSVTGLKKSTTTPHKSIAGLKKSTTTPHKSIAGLKKSTTAPHKPITVVKKATTTPHKPIVGLKKSTTAPHKPITVVKKATTTPHKPIAGLKKSTTAPHKPITVVKKATAAQQKSVLHSKKRVHAV